jgi:Ca2+-binding RTX toxin-like protein
MAFIRGTNWDNNLYGTFGNDIIHGLDGVDFIFGLQGHDDLKGGGGADQIDGGFGIDQAIYADSPVGVTVNLTTGEGFGGTAEGDYLTGIENLMGSMYDDVFYGDALANVLTGAAGNDTLKGAGGADRLDGGNGSGDTASYWGSADRVSVSLQSLNATGGDAEGDILIGIENLAGSSHADFLEGDGGVNVLNGGKGDDLLRGRGGNDDLLGGDHDDHLEGGPGADDLFGGDGWDTAAYLHSAAAVTVSLTDGTASGGDAAGDTFSSIESLSGSNFNDTLTGSSAHNTLWANRGGDHLTGGMGADSFVYAVIEDSGISMETVDVIHDFSRAEGDRIDVLRLDANAAMPGLQSWTFVDGDYTGVGQIRAVSDGVDTYIAFSNYGDPDNEAAIKVLGMHTVDASWFRFEFV